MSSTVLVPQGDKYDQREVIETIKQTVCKGATDAQLKMFIEVCRSTGLNPWLKEIYYVPEKGIIMAGRDGYLRVANENPQFDGMETRVERDEKNIPIKAVCTVWRKDRNHPTIMEAFFNEYRKSSPVWTQYPSAMIAKVAEVLALKRSFSINGVVTEEEIGEQGGSADAAKAIAERKIEALKAGVPAAQVAEVLPPMELEEQLQASIEHVKTTRKKKLTGSRIALLEAFAGLKKRYKAIDAEKSYYAVLGRAGHHHSDEFPDNDLGMEAARATYKEMSLHVADMEALHAKESEKTPGQKASDKFWAGQQAG